MQKIYDQIQSLGGEVLVVSFTTPKLIAAYRAENPSPFPVVCDPERKAYQAFSLGATNVRGFLRLGVIWRYLRLIFRGWIPKGTGENADVWQLGGDFVIDATGRLRYAYPSKDSTDRPSNAELLQAMDRAKPPSEHG